MKSLRQDLRFIYFQLDKILLLFAFIFGFIEWFWLPVNSWLAEKLLALTGNLYLSYTNFWSVMLGQPWIGFAFLALLLLNLSISYLQLSLIFLGIYQLLQEPSQGLKVYCQQLLTVVWSSFKRASFGQVLSCLLYLLLLFPFWGRLLKIYFLDKILIPQFIVDYLSANTYIAFGLLLLGFMLAYLSLRYFFLMPYILYQGASVKEALGRSWEKTGSVWPYFWSLVKLFALVLSLFFMAILLGIGLQILADSLPNDLSLLVAILNYVGIKLVWYVLIGFMLIRLVQLFQEQRIVSQRLGSLHHPFRWLILLMTLVVLTSQALSYYFHPYEGLPVTISHRGVTDKNGIQNTIMALEKTAPLKPDYVEVDIQESKDGQFVMMHDQNLQALAGIDGKTHDFTLEELTQMTLAENGYRSQMDSFEAYLSKAEELGQKLLVEIKTNPEDSKTMMSTFLSRYGQRLKKGGHLLQSLDYRVIEAVKAYDKKLVTYFILPYNSIFPRTQANGYTMEYSSLTFSFMDKLRRQEKTVFAWTANDPDTVEKLITMEVDGIITDRLTETQRMLKENAEDRNYLDLFLRFVAELTMDL